MAERNVAADAGEETIRDVKTPQPTRAPNWKNNGSTDLVNLSEHGMKHHLPMQTQTSSVGVNYDGLMLLLQDKVANPIYSIYINSVKISKGKLFSDPLQLAIV